MPDDARNPRTPPPLTGGRGRTKALPRNIELTDCPADYARLVARGFDSYQEAWNWLIGMEAQARLDQAQQRARDAGEPVLMEWRGGEGMVGPGGAKGGKRWTVKTDCFLFMFGSPNSEWQISVRYLSAGLWQFGLGELRRRVADTLHELGCRQRDPLAHDDKWCRVSRLDYAFDFYSRALTAEIGPDWQKRIVAHSSVKCRAHGAQETEPEVPWEMIGTSGRTETLTIGSITGLQIQVYDKTTEIREASGKDWMVELWAAGADGEVFDADVWRFECRFGKRFLKDRNLRTRAQVDAALPDLILEAAIARRVCVPVPGDTNKRRWPVHPLWSEVARLSGGDAFVPVGRMVTMRRDEYLDMMERQAVGVVRVFAVGRDGDLDMSVVPDILKAAEERLRGDPSNRRKVPILKDRLSGLYDEAQ